MDLHPVPFFWELSQCPLISPASPSLHFPFPLLFSHLRLKAAQHIQSGLAPAVVVVDVRSAVTERRGPTGSQCQAMTPTCLPRPSPREKTQGSHDLTAGQLSGQPHHG